MVSNVKPKLPTPPPRSIVVAASMETLDVAAPDEELMVEMAKSGSGQSYYGESAEDLLASGEVDAIEWLISDVELPGQTGIALAEQLLASKPDLKVILMSGHHVGRSINHLGSVVFLEKPFSLQQLTEIVHGSSPTQSNNTDR